MSLAENVTGRPFFSAAVYSSYIMFQSHRIHETGIFYLLIHVGKYTSPMDLMGIDHLKNSLHKQIVLQWASMNRGVFCYITGDFFVTTSHRKTHQTGR